MPDNQTQIDETIKAFKKLGEKADVVIDTYLVKGAKVLQTEAITKSCHRTLDIKG